MTYNPTLEISKLYKKYLKNCQRNNIKPNTKECMSIDMLKKINDNMSDKELSMEKKIIKTITKL